MDAAGVWSAVDKAGVVVHRIEVIVGIYGDTGHLLHGAVGDKTVPSEYLGHVKDYRTGILVAVAVNEIH